MTSNDSDPPRSLFSKLQDDIFVSILARISASYYPMISLVSKRFRSLILSEELDMERSRLGTRQAYVYVCLQSSIETCDRRWFSLWKKPYDHLPLTHCTVEIKCTENWLLPMPSSYSRRFTTRHEIVGSETYEIGGQNTASSSSDVWVYDNKLNGKRRKAPSMLLARRNALTCSMDGKIYVMGGCEVDESTHWAEVFDPKTQTWEPLQDPGVELRYSLVEDLQADEGKIYVISRSNKNNFIYHTKESVWEVAETSMAETRMQESVCEIENVQYCYGNKRLWWFDTKQQHWRSVKGLDRLEQRFKIDTAIGNYGGKLVVFWGRTLYPLAATKKVWCAVILPKKNIDGDVWGKIEWLDVVLIVPREFTLLNCVNSWQ